MEKKDDALFFSGFEGCASSREYYWHLAADKEDQWDRFPRAHSYEWVGQCGLGPIDPELIVKHLVEDGGWLLVGDSVTENHFFSLSCLLYPHVIATPKYTEGVSFDRGWPQNLYLNPSSPLLQHKHISFPDGFDITVTPLVTFRRIDLLFSQAELLDIHRSIYPSPPQAQGFKLFSDEPVWTLPLASYLDLFTSPLPLGNYATMVVSTAGHWTTTLFSGYRDEDKADAGYGIDPGLLSFFNEAMTIWAREVQAVLWNQHRSNLRFGRPAKKKKRRVLVRSYLPGHEDCHAAREPWAEVQPFVWNWYNWGYVDAFNRVFETILAERTRFPDIYYLPIDRPGRLRPDAHTTGDCLHIMTGAGVLEGWTHYIWHYVTHEIV